MDALVQERPFGLPGSSVVIELSGAPVPKGRPRFGHGRAYTPQRTRNYEQDLQWQAKLAMRGRLPFDGPIRVEVLAAFPIAASWPNAKKIRACAGTIRHTSRPDVDNLLKCVGDALNGIVWRDDSQIVIATIAKRYSDHPRLRIEVTTAIGEGA